MENLLHQESLRGLQTQKPRTRQTKLCKTPTRPELQPRKPRLRLKKLKTLLQASSKHRARRKVGTPASRANLRSQSKRSEQGKSEEPVQKKKCTPKPFDPNRQPTRQITDVLVPAEKNSAIDKAPPNRMPKFESCEQETTYQEGWKAYA